MSKIAIVGSGISGLTCAYLLSQEHQVTVFESNDYLGGHTHTHSIDIEGKSVAVDTGFIVYNDRSYPNFEKLLDVLGVKGTATEMSFSVRDDQANLEYNGHNINTLFAQRRNIVSPRFWRMVKEILRFNKEAKEILPSETLSLGEYLVTNKYSDFFQAHYLLPMAAAIWSTGDEEIKAFPIASLAHFFNNHGLLDIKNRPQWYVVNGGSNRYVTEIEKHLKDVRLNTAVASVTRQDKGVTVTANEEQYHFDEIIFACHSDQALALLSDPSEQEQSVLGNISYTHNTATLHTDTNALPVRSSAWASWNYLIDPEQRNKATLTYNMNILQHHELKQQLLVTLNDSGKLDRDKIINTFEYMHPLFNQDTIDAQTKHKDINNKQHTHYCGAYWSYGFHEDGVKSALRVCESFAVSLDRPQSQVVSQETKS